MARSTQGVDDSDPQAFWQHMQKAVTYTTTQTTGTVMRTMPKGAARKLPEARPRPQAYRPTIEAYISYDAAYLAANPYTP